MTLSGRGRLYCGYDFNTNETNSLMGVYERFPFPSTGYTIWRDTGHLSIDTANSASKFTWNGSDNTWVHVEAVCNIKKGTGANLNIDVGVVWKLNSANAGPIRKSYMNTDSMVISGGGWFQLNTGDYVEPFIANLANDNKCLLTNCTFSFLMDSGY